MFGRLLHKAAPELPLLLVLALGLVLRLYRLDLWPPVHVDEAITGNMAREVWSQLRDPFSAHPGYHFANVATLLYSPLLQIPATGLWTLRLTSVVFGVLTILATYYLARDMFDRRVGLIAAFVVSTSHVAVAYSRLGLGNVLVPLWQVLTFLFLWRALGQGRLRDWVLAGVLLGTGMYLYFSFRVTLLVTGLFFLVVGLRHPSIFRRHAQGMILGAACFAILILPLGVRFAQSPHQFVVENTDVTLLSEPGAFKEGYETDDLKKVVWEQSLKTYRWFTEGGDTSPQYGNGGPAVDVVTRLLLVLGLAVAVWRLGAPRYLLLFLWLLATPVLGGMLTGAPPQSSRLLGVVPPLAILAAVGAVGIGRILARSLTAVQIGLALFVAGSLVALVNYDAYFNRYSKDDIYWPWTEPYATLSRYTNSLGSARVYILSTTDVFSGQSIVRFLSYRGKAEILDITGWDSPGFRFDQEVSVQRTVFVFLPENRSQLPKLAAQYAGEMKEFRGYVFWGDEGELFTSYELLSP